ncbi:hypothetical protein SAMN05421827_109152 [Pedobacter terrae]|uniref:Heavy-metal-binding n=1 Tax=Pedobacter terrae TaxID=405671 RepID=A0A1G7W905_9SPHI|nr:hypothetical protein [Pedobacter terrae]SDG68422.1 hypothetical protein SAMN05421827_109152 [Pedobacter terrae]
MKKLMLLTLLAAGLTSCSVRLPVVRTSSAIDYSEYAKQGIFLTESNSVNFSYEPIASVSAIHLSGYELSDKGEKKFKDDVLGSLSGTNVVTTGVFSSATRSSVLAELCKKAHLAGGNGIINLKINFVPATPSTYSGYEATGMAIKK